MTVRCPECDTAYHVALRSQMQARATFRCSRCEHVFEFDDGPAEPVLLEEAPEADEEPEDADPGARASYDVAASTGRQAGRFAARAFVGVSVAFALLSIYVVTHPGRLARLLGTIPIVGADLAAKHLSPAHVQLTDVHGTYTRVHGDTLVFVVSGTAVNNSPVPVRAIEISARVKGTREQQRSVFAGAAPRDVHGLSEREIDLLQTLRPPHDWRLLPGEDGEFLVAFVDPPVPLKEFSAQVVSVQRGERRTSGG